MKNKEGFTLIELLAVIVILAIIALIATPQVLNIINESKISASKRSAEGYISAVKNAIANKLVEDPTFVIGEVYKVDSNGNICIESDMVNNVCTNEIKVDIEGTKPEASSVIELDSKGTIEFYSLDIENNTYSNATDSACFLTRNIYSDNAASSTYKITSNCKSAFENAEQYQQGASSLISTCDGTADAMINALKSAMELEEEEATNYLIAYGALEEVNTSTLTGKKIVSYICNDTDIIIPNKIDTIPIVSIENAVFAGKTLKSVYFSKSSEIKTIGESAFSENQLTSIILPDTVTTIGNSAFAGNYLTSINIPNSVTTIGKLAFDYNNLTSVIIGSGISSIGDAAFGDEEDEKGYGPNDLKSVIINITDGTLSFENNNFFPFGDFTNITYNG